MLIKIILLLIVFIVPLLPILFSGKLKPKDNLLRNKSELEKKIKTTHPKYQGPKSDERIDKMLAECIALLEKLSVPISKSICPNVVLTGSRCYYGRCCPKGSLKKYTEFDFYIEVSGYTLNNSEKSLRNTLIHELIHTVPGGMYHTGEWKEWANYVSQKTGYKIQRLGGDKDERDENRVRTYGFSGIFS